MKNKKPVGAPRKPPTSNVVLRVNTELWQSVSAKYPRQINKMFIQWIKSL